MHATVKNLIGIRDGEPIDADIARHVAECHQCGAELLRLMRLRTDLRRLAAFEPPSRSWAAIERRLQSPAVTPRRAPDWRGSGWRATSWRATAAAALLAGLILVLLIGPVMHGHRAANPVGATANSGEALGSLVARSQQLETILGGLQRPRLERAATSAAIDELQARIEVLDMQLSSAPENGLSGTQAQQLWSERVQLLSSLVNVRYAEQAARGNDWPAMTTGDI
jgi:hypothetical protein